MSQKTLAQLKNEILADGKVDASEVEELRGVIYDASGSGGVRISEAEAKMLLDIQNGVSGAQNHPSWRELYIDALTSYCLDDETTPGVLDESEGNFLMTNFQAGGVDDVEKAAIANILASASSVPSSFRSWAASL